MERIADDRKHANRVSIRIEGGVADVRLNRPDKMNAIDGAMCAGLIEAGRSVGADRSVRAVVLSGEGRAFCAGLDFGLFEKMAGGEDGAAGGLETLAARYDDSPANGAQRCAYIWQEIPVPVLAAVHGVAFGGGFQIAMGADIRYLSWDAEMSVMEIKWGLIPDMSGTQTLRHLVRLDVAKELTFTGRVIDAQEALKLGLATHLSDDPHADAMAAARQIAGKSPDAIRAAKKLLNETVTSTVAEGFRRELETQLTLIGRSNQMEAVMANLEKREPEFGDPK
jgi:enoyl-CoA hydratase/carnithine racemase